jgi:dienelactone hydrolase
VSIALHRAFLLLLRLSFAVLAGAALVVAYLYTRDYSEEFREMKGEVERVTLEPVDGDSLFDRSWLTVQSSSGLEVVSGILTPSRQTLPGDQIERFPAVILLGGKATGKYAVDYALGIRNIILVAPDYPYEPRPSYTVGEFASDVPAIRKAILDMFPSVMLVIDYLFTRPDVDTTKIVVLGYSFGAPFIPGIVANDRRPAVAAIVYGGGGMRTLIRHNVRRYRGAIVSEAVGTLSGLLLRPVEPLRYVDHISPIPLVMINGTEDEQVPRENTLALFERAGEPKRLVWIESRHVNPRNVDLTKKIIASLVKELQELRIFDERQRL